MEIRVKVNSTYNNTIVTALHKDRILKTISTGSIGFKKAKRASTLAAQAAGESLGYWLLLLDKALSQKTTLTKSRIDGTAKAESQSGFAQNAPSQSKLASSESRSNEVKGGKGVDVQKKDNSAKSVKTSHAESLESLQLKEIANPKLKIPNAKLVASGGNLSSAVGRSAKGNKGNLATKDSRKTNNSETSSSASSGMTKGRGLSRGTGSLAFIKPLSVMVSGVGHGKFGAIKGLAKMGIKIKRISEITAIPHNGCKPPKMRRK